MPVDKTAAVKWYRKAAEQGFAQSQHNLGLCYANGEGVPVDMAEAVKWFRKAAEQGDSYSANMLGVCYTKGIGVEQDEEESIKWYRIAAEGGETWAYYNLGLALQNYSEATDRDCRESLSWLSKAVDEGIEGAQEALDNAYNPDAPRREDRGGGFVGGVLDALFS